jgi:hypothetical protein
VKALFARIDEHVQQYEQGTITISGDIEFSTYQNVRQITHYILSKYFKKEKSNAPETRRFRNIGNSIVDIEWRAKNIDRKSVEAHATDGDAEFSLIVTKEVQQWMKVNNFGKTIDDYQRKKSEYGSVLLKKTETADKLIIEPVKWENIAVDPRDIRNGMKVEKNYLTLLDIKKKADVWTEETDGVSSIELAIAAAKKQKSSDGEKRVEILDIEGEFEHCDIYPEEEGDEPENDTIGLYNVIVAVVGQKRWVLYKTKLTASRFKYDVRKEVEGRDFGMGVWEECFEPQIATNENVLDEREAMSLAGKVFIKTNKKNLPTAAAMVNGEVIDLEADEFFDTVSLAPKTLPQFQNIVDAWFQNMQRDQSAYPGVSGEEPKASTPALSLQLQAAQGGSIFNKRRDQDAYCLLEVIMDWVVPFNIKQINKQHVLTASYSPRELEKVDEGIRNWYETRNVVHHVLSDTLVTPEMQAGFRAEADAKLQRQGSNRTLKIPKGYITLERIQKKVRFDITNEMEDSQRRLNALATTLSQMEPTDPERRPIIQEMMEVAGISAASFGVGSTAPPTAPNVGTPSPLTPSRVTAVLPEGQQV